MENELRGPFAAAVEVATGLVLRPEVTARWEAESACADMSVGALARHVVGQWVNVERLLREPAAADPMPLLLSAAIRPMSFDGPAHDLAPLAPEADIEAVVGACVAALEDEALDAALGGAADGSAGSA